MDIKIIKFRDDVVIPTRAYTNDAGLDCYAIEDITLNNCLFPVGARIDGERISKVAYKIPLGFGLDLPDGYVALIKPRSSMNAKGIITHEGVIDSSYKGEIQAVLSNLGDPITLKKGERICQLLILPIAVCNLVEEFEKERGTGGFGSSGK